MEIFDKSLLWIGGSVYLLAGWIAGRNSGSYLNPFTTVAILWFLAISNYSLGLAIPHNKEFYIISSSCLIFIIISAIIYLILCLQIRKTPCPRFYVAQENTPFKLIQKIFFLLLISLVLITLLSVRHNNGLLPVVALNQYGSAKSSIGYDDVHLSFFTPLSFGLHRFMITYLAASWFFSKQSLSQHINSNRRIYIITAISTGLILSMGMRNPLVYTIILYFFVYITKFGLKRSDAIRVIFFSLAFSFLFALAFEYRSGKYNPYHDLKHEIETPIVGPVTNMLVKYTAAIVPNLNTTMSLSSQERSFGLILLSEMVPDALLGQLVDLPENHLHTMLEKKQLPFGGNTFRTFYSDLYPDFGYLGTLLVGTIILSASVLLHNRSGNSLTVSFTYLLFLPSILFTPFLNTYTGLPVLVPLLIFALIKFIPSKPLPPSCLS